MTSVVFFAFGNIGPTPIMIVLLSDGSLQSVNTTTKIGTQIAPAGTIVNPSLGNIGVSQWGSQFIIIVANQTNGYFLWDGTTFYVSGGIAPPVEITAGGSGYTSGATVAFSGGSGTGATGTVDVENGIVISVKITNSGSGWLVGETVTVTINPVGAGSGATGTVTLMPFGVKGTAVETYQSIVWVDDDDTGVFTAPESVNDFATADGGGTFTSLSSYLRVKWVRFIATNGFLYLIGDSSIDYLSGVNTAGSPTPITTFTKQNADPEIGTPFADTVTVFSRNIVLANMFGVHVSYGGAVTKISDNLDGVYNTVMTPATPGTFIPSSAKAIIYGKKVFMLLLPVIDVFTGQHINKLFLWDGKKWFSSDQDVSLIFINCQEIDSVITAYGTDGNAIYPLFQVPSTAFRKTVQSKLWERPGSYMLQKGVSRIWGLARYQSNLGKELDITIDNETGTSPVTITPPDLPVVIINGLGNQVVVLNGLGIRVLVIGNGVGIAVFPPNAVGQIGVITGITLSTFAADMTLISMMIRDEITQYRG